MPSAEVTCEINCFDCIDYVPSLRCWSRGIGERSIKAHRRSHSFAPGGFSLFCRYQGWADRPNEIHRAFWSEGNGGSPGGVRQGEFRSSSPVDRYRVAAIGPRHSKRLQPSAFWRRSNRGRSYLAAGRSYPSTAVGRQEPHSGFTAAVLRPNSYSRRRTRLPRLLLRRHRDVTPRPRERKSILSILKTARTSVQPPSSVSD